MRYILTIACIVLSAVAVAWPVHADVSGWVQVIDGDTIEVAGTRIRLFGIDAPERGQGCQDEGELWACGGLARLRLEDRISGHTVVCEERDQDRYGRIVAVCRADGEDLNAWMVSQGWALAYHRYSQAYVDEEADAKAACQLRLKFPTFVDREFLTLSVRSYPQTQCLGVRTWSSCR